jgi:hypothetical protein
MSTVQGGQGNIVTNGLVLNLDAANPRSYPQPYNGITWTDLSGLGNNGTLISGVVYTGSNGGSLVFNGLNGYISTTYNSNVAFLNRDPYTLEVFANPLPASQYPGWINREANLGSGRDGYNLIYTTFGNPPGIVGIITERFTSGTGIQVSSYISTSSFFGGWNHIVSTYDGSTLSLYINGISRASSTSTGSLTNNSTALQIGARGFDESSGQIAISRIYNRALNSSEVLQNFNATRARFGI